MDAQVVLIRRTGGEACRQVGELARPVSTVAAEFGVCWWTVMNAAVHHGTPLVADRNRIGAVERLRIDETSFLAANRSHATAVRHRPTNAMAWLPTRQQLTPRR